MYKSNEFTSRFAAVGKSVQIFEHALILKPEHIVISEGVRIDDYARIEGGEGITIGRYVHIASFASILGGGSVEIGDFAGIAQGARIVTGKGHPFEDKFPAQPPEEDPFHTVRGKIILGAFSFVAVNAVILPNVEIGEGAIVGACSVVRDNVAPWCIVYGSPARPVGERKKFI